MSFGQQSRTPGPPAASRRLSIRTPKTTRSRRLSKTSVTRSRSGLTRSGSCQVDQPGWNPEPIASTCRAAVTSRQHLIHGGGGSVNRGGGEPTNQDRSGSHSPSNTQHGPLSVHGVKLDKRRTCSQRISFRTVPSGRIEHQSICRHEKKGNSARSDGPIRPIPQASWTAQAPSTSR